MILSIIVPFHNSEKKCHRLLKTLADVQSPAVELVLVDDGSTDATPSVLEGFSHTSRASTIIVSQENRGPGGARNAGLKAASGEYVWFVDSDDDIDLKAVNFVMSLRESKYDLIDFNYVSRGDVVNSMRLSVGEHEDEVMLRSVLLNGFGRICTKVIRRELILDNEIEYPEFCIYEDNALLFVYPFFVKKMFKSDIVGYFHCEDYDSVTRSVFSFRYLDRMYTAAYGFSRSLELASPEERDVLEVKFIRLYLLNTVRKLTNKKSGISWRLIARIMRQYRMDAKVLGVKSSPLRHLAGSVRRRLIFVILWNVSCFLPDQQRYFKDTRDAIWGK